MISRHRTAHSSPEATPVLQRRARRPPPRRTHHDDDLCSAPTALVASSLGKTLAPAPSPRPPRQPPAAGGSQRARPLSTRWTRIWWPLCWPTRQPPLAVHLQPVDRVHSHVARPHHRRPPWDSSPRPAGAIPSRLDGCRCAPSVLHASGSRRVPPGAVSSSLWDTSTLANAFSTVSLTRCRRPPTGCWILAPRPTSPPIPVW
jgi:hypothetical protein